jgi:hypothetical protein
MQILILRNLPQDLAADLEIGQPLGGKKNHQGSTKIDTTTGLVMVTGTTDTKMKVTATKKMTDVMSGLEDQLMIDIKEVITKINIADMKTSLLATIEAIIVVIVVMIVTVVVTVEATAVIVVMIVAIEVLIVVVTVVVITAVKEMKELVIYKDIKEVFKEKEKELAIVTVTVLVEVTIAQATATEVIESLVELREREVGRMSLITHQTTSERSRKVTDKEWQGCQVQSAERCSKIGTSRKSLKDRVRQMQKRTTENRINC